jgi:hypothetical protein
VYGRGAIGCALLPFPTKVKHDYASFELGTPSHVDNMSEEATSILSGILTNAPEQVGMDLQLLNYS